MSDEEIIDSIYQHAAPIRGHFINRVSIIEKQIEFKIGMHFCKDQTLAYEMMDILLGDRLVNFDSKIIVFRCILKKHYPDIFSNSKQQINELSNIQKHRNRFAHLAAYIGPEAIHKYKTENIVGFIKFSENTGPIWYDENEISKIDQVMDAIDGWLKTIII